MLAGLRAPCCLRLTAVCWPLRPRPATGTASATALWAAWSVGLFCGAVNRRAAPFFSNFFTPSSRASPLWQAAHALSEYSAVSQGSFSRAADVALLAVTCDGGSLAALPLGVDGAFLLAVYEKHADGGAPALTLTRTRAVMETARAALAPHVDGLGHVPGALLPG